MNSELGPNFDQRVLVIIPRDNHLPVREFHPRAQTRSWHKLAVQVLERLASSRLSHAVAAYDSVISAAAVEAAAGASASVEASQVSCEGEDELPAAAADRPAGSATPVPPSNCSIRAFLDHVASEPLEEKIVKYSDGWQSECKVKPKNVPTGVGVIVVADSVDFGGRQQCSLLDGTVESAPLFDAGALSAWMGGSVRAFTRNTSDSKEVLDPEAGPGSTSGPGVAASMFDMPKDHLRWNYITQHWAGIDVFEGIEPRTEVGTSGWVPGMAHFPPGWHDDFDTGNSMDLNLEHPSAPVNSRASSLVGMEVRGDAVLCLGVGQILYKLLRPEAVQQAAAPLSSDALSGFAQCSLCSSHGCGHCSDRFNEQSIQASNKVLREGLGDLARSLVDGSVSISDPG